MTDRNSRTGFAGCESQPLTLNSFLTMSHLIHPPISPPARCWYHPSQVFFLKWLGKSILRYHPEQSQLSILLPTQLSDYPVLVSHPHTPFCTFVPSVPVNVMSLPSLVTCHIPAPFSNAHVASLQKSISETSLSVTSLSLPL